MKRALVATANDKCRDLLEGMLSGRGFMVVPARDTAQAISLLGESATDLLLLDARLPGATADSVLQLLEPNQFEPDQKVLLVTCASGRKVKEQGPAAINLLDMLKAKSLEAELLRELGKLTVRGGELGGACSKLMELALRLTGAAGALLAVRDHERIGSQVASSQPLTASFWRRLMARTAEVAEGFGLANVTARRLEEGLESELEEAGESANPENPAIRGFRVFPLIGRGGPRGLLALGFATTPRLSPAVDEALKLAVPYGGVVLENLLLHRRLWEISRVDELTRLANRREFEERLSVELRRYRRYGTGFSLIMMDLDNFKGVNDKLGHVVGDQAIAAAGQALRSTLRAVDVCARFGGDEFVAILPETTSYLELIGGRVHEAVQTALLHISGVSSVPGVGVSLGIACCPDHGTAREELLEAADIALYLAKRPQAAKVQLAQASARVPSGARRQGQV